MMLMIVPINEKHIEKTNHNMVLTINFRFNRVLYGMKIAINNLVNIHNNQQAAPLKRL